MLVAGNILVDPGPLPHIKARYINDPLNETFFNVKYVPDALQSSVSSLNCRYSSLDPIYVRSAVVTTRAIQPNEEIFGAYGDVYWSCRTIPGRMMK